MYFNSGYLSNPVSKYPNLFAHLGTCITQFLIEYPYFLPCFVATCISTCCWLLGFFFLKETLQLSKLVNNGREEAPLLSNADPQQQQNYNAVAVTEQPDITRPHLTLSEKLTPPVLAISILYAVTAFQMLYFDGKFRAVNSSIA